MTETVADVAVEALMETVARHLEETKIVDPLAVAAAPPPIVEKVSKARQKHEPVSQLRTGPEAGKLERKVTRRDFIAWALQSPLLQPFEQIPAMFLFDDTIKATAHEDHP